MEVHTPYLSKDILEDTTEDISGPPAMVAAAKKLLKKDAHSIHTDYFSGY